jgi:RNA polymerase sigma-B factor
VSAVIPRLPDSTRNGAAGAQRKARRQQPVHGTQQAVRTAALLLRAAESTNPRQRHDLIREVVRTNMGVAEAIASKYRRRGVPDEDLKQVAYLALVNAARRFDVGGGHDFLSYAVPTIRGELKRYFRDSGWMVRPTRKVQELQARIFAAESELCMTLGRSPSVGEVACHLDAPRRDVEEALAADSCFSPASLDKPVGTSEATSCMAELLGGRDAARGAAEARILLAPLVRNLSPRDREVLRLRFFEDRTQRDIAIALGITQTQVSRILSRTMHTLRHQLDGPSPHASSCTVA